MNRLVIVAVAVALALVLCALGAFVAGAARSSPVRVGDEVTIVTSAWHPETIGHTGTITKTDPTSHEAEVKVDKAAGGSRRQLQWYLWTDLEKQGRLTPTPTPAPACANGYVSLSYDDGPTAMTRQYVDAFTARGDKAMFFFIGDNVQARPSDAQYASSNGMVIGNHTWDHPDLATLPRAAQTDELKRQKDIVQSTTGQAENVFRPPYGAYTGTTYTLARNLGMDLVSWTDDTKDYTDPSTAATVNFVLSRAADQKIFLMHDGHANTLAAIPQILDGLTAKGLCSGKIVPSATPMPNAWGDPQYVRVVPF
jgi:peptidoglycan/xylan/chitin deacetylase (PgdA/CDA1 family)